jgi:hypothetical protein
VDHGAGAVLRAYWCIPVGLGRVTSACGQWCRCGGPAAAVDACPASVRLVDIRLPSFLPFLSSGARRPGSVHHRLRLRLCQCQGKPLLISAAYLVCCPRAGPRGLLAVCLGRALGLRWRSRASAGCQPRSDAAASTAPACSPRSPAFLPLVPRCLPSTPFIMLVWSSL